MKPIILVVEDEPLVRMDAVDLAREGGFETIEASSAGQAILESRSDIRVVFTDVRMRTWTA